jgi:hypothetical protein
MPLKSRSQEDLLAGSRDDAAVAMALTSLLLLRPEGGSQARSKDFGGEAHVRIVSIMKDFRSSDHMKQ